MCDFKIIVKNLMFKMLSKLFFLQFNFCLPSETCELPGTARFCLMYIMQNSCILTNRDSLDSYVFKLLRYIRSTENKISKAVVNVMFERLFHLLLSIGGQVNAKR